MTKQSNLKFLRQYFPNTLKDEHQVPVDRAVYKCPVCGNPLLVSIGQIVACHKQCKPRYKRLLKINGQIYGEKN